MSTVEAGSQREDGVYGRAAKRLKMEEPPLEEKEDRAEDELEEGEDSDSGSLPGNGEAETDSRARWSGRQFGSGRKVDGVSIQASRLRGRAQNRRYLAGSLAFTGVGCCCV